MRGSFASLPAFPIAGLLVAALGLAQEQALVAEAPGICPEGKRAPVTAVLFELLTGEEVLRHLPGPTPGDAGDGRIGTDDDGLHPGLTDPPAPAFSPIFGTPNDLGGEGCDPVFGIACGLPGSPGTRRLHGTTLLDSQESSLHPPASDELSLARPGHGAYSFVRARMGELEALSYLAGGFVLALDGFDGTAVETHLVNVTVGGTTLFPTIFFATPFNIDLITVGPGSDLSWSALPQDANSESVVRGCNGLAPGSDAVDAWFPVSPGPFPVFPDLGVANGGAWRLSPRTDPSRRLLEARADLLVKVPAAAGFFTLKQVPWNGYLMPLVEAQALLGDNAGGNLPDIPGFEGSGTELARYFAEVLAPRAGGRSPELLVGFFRSRAEVRLIDRDVALDLTLVGTGELVELDLCSIDVRPCTF